MKENIKKLYERYPDKDAGIHFCSRCNKDTEYYYTFYANKHGYYIKFCKGCNYGNYNECPEAINTEVKTSENIKHSFFQVGMNQKDIVGEYFKELFDKNPTNGYYAEVQEFKNSDTRISILRKDNRVRAFVIETRTDYNDIEFIKGEVNL